MFQLSCEKASSIKTIRWTTHRCTHQVGSKKWDVIRGFTHPTFNELLIHKLDIISFSISKISILTFARHDHNNHEPVTLDKGELRVLWVQFTQFSIYSQNAQATLKDFSDANKHLILSFGLFVGKACLQSEYFILYLLLFYRPLAMSKTDVAFEL